MLSEADKIQIQEHRKLYDNFIYFVEDITDSLKPCPFCGSRAKAEQFEDGMGYDKSWDFRIKCENLECAANFHVGLCEPRFYGDTSYRELMKKNEQVVTNTVEKWNRRA
jgi:hypothetical protein